MASPRVCCFSLTLSKSTMVPPILSDHFVNFRTIKTSDFPMTSFLAWRGWLTFLDCKKTRMRLYRTS